MWDYNANYRYARTVTDISRLAYERTVIQPRDASADAFARLANVADETGNVVVVVEEVQEYVTPHKLIGESFFRTGRNRGATWVAVTQRPAEISSSLVSNAHHRFVFRLTHPNDTKFLQKWIHPSIDPANLEPFYHYYHTKLEAKPPVLCKPVPFTEAL